MARQPRIHPAAIDLLARVFNSHRKGLPEWMKNSREAYLRQGIPETKRIICLNHNKNSHPETLECIDFVGISGEDIEERYLEWANPEAAAKGIKAGEVEGGQGNGGKAYLRQMFSAGYLISIRGGELSVVSFVDKEKYILDFVPDAVTGKDSLGDNPIVPGIREYAESWLKAHKLPAEHNITIVRGVSPTKGVDLDRLIKSIQQFPQARESIRTCTVMVYKDRNFVRRLEIISPKLHHEFPEPIVIKIPEVLGSGSTSVATCRDPDYPAAELTLKISSQALQGQSLGSWNRIDFHGTTVSTLGSKPIDELSLAFPQYGRYVFGSCRCPLLVSPDDNYEMQGRVRLNDGPLSRALYGYISKEIDKLLEKLAKKQHGKAVTRRRKNLERLNKRLSRWIESKLSSLRGLNEDGEEDGAGRPTRRPRRNLVHKSAIKIKIHRESLEICGGVKYQLRAMGIDEEGRPVPPGKLIWRSMNSSILAVSSDTGALHPKSPGMTTVDAQNEDGLKAEPVVVTVIVAAEIKVKASAPVRVGTNRRLPLPVNVIDEAGRRHKNPIVGWKTSDPTVVSIGQDGTLVGGEVGEAEVVAIAGGIESEPLEIVVEKGAAGRPKGGGRGKPKILLSGQDPCPFDGTHVELAPTDPPVYQRAYKQDYDNNVFWINLQHPLAEALLRQGEESVQWRTYHFQRLVDVYTVIELRSKFAESEQLDVDQVLDEVGFVAAEIYGTAKDELFEILYDENLDISSLSDKP